jgi:hypothetical protein
MGAGAGWPNERDGLDGVDGMAGEGRAGDENDREPRLPPRDARAQASVVITVNPHRVMRLVKTRIFRVVM